MKVSLINLFTVVVLVGFTVAQETTTTPTFTTIVETTSTLISTSTLAPTTSTSTSSTTPITSSTSVPVTTKAPEPPVPEDVTWNVTDGNITCIRAELKMAITIVLGDRTQTVVLPQTASDEGSQCSASNVTQVFALAWEHYILALEFEKDSDGVFVKNMTFVKASPDDIELFYNDTKRFATKAGNSYLCRSTEAISMGNVTVQIYNIHIQAFGTDNGKDFSTAEECEADDTMSDVIPIVVACVLAALIVLVLIAYLVGRRRNRQKGYTSV